MGLNKAIQTYRINLGMTQKELATKANLAEITIRKYESGERYPKAVQLKKIATALNVSVKDLHDLEFCFDNNITLEQLHNRESEIDKSGALLNMFEKLNTQGQDKAIEHIEMLTKIPEYQKKDRNTTSTPIAAHNDHINKPGELKKVQSDVELLKRPDTKD